MGPSTSGHAFHPRPIQGWALKALLPYDEKHPGFLRYAIGASPLRRQTIVLTLSYASFNGPEVTVARFHDAGLVHPSDLAEQDAQGTMTRALMRQSNAALVAALHPGAKGLMGILDRLGNTLLHPFAYRGLVDLLSMPEHEPRAEVLRQLETITPMTASVLRALPVSFLHAQVVRRLETPEEVEELQSVISLIRAMVPAVTDEELLNSIAKLRPRLDFDDWARRWMMKGVFAITPPVQDDQNWVGLRSPQAMFEASNRFYKGLKDEIPSVAVGRSYFLEYCPAPAIIELRRLSRGQWLLHSVHGRPFVGLSHETARAIRRKLVDAGILLPACLDQSSRYNKVAALLNIFDSAMWELDNMRDDAGPFSVGVAASDPAGDPLPACGLDWDGLMEGQVHSLAGAPLSCHGS
ncbi:hypothetical protein JKG68_10790 [Microvirga aerilata]|uniref:Uncharacterized protein n=1 Tax=Microvirga aerilata TaxID=670292 RepID=A0A936ZB41_9HYPH|nr:hypothetical protein [Microvirga aerilata]MBL0404455.1 hypothetical protein [Microvirga aerilata]